MSQEELRRQRGFCVGQPQSPSWNTKLACVPFLERTLSTVRLFPYVCSPAVATAFMDQQVTRLTLKPALSSPNSSEVDDADGVGDKALSASTGWSFSGLPALLRVRLVLLPCY